MSSSKAPQEPTTTIPKVTSSENDPDITAFFTWSNLFKCLAGNCTPQEREKYLTARDIIKEESDCKRCEEWRDWNFKYSPTVRFMRDQINTVGPDLTPEHVKCMRCPFDRKGGFNLGHGILLCANHLTSRKRLEDTLAHEMVHAYDYLRWDVDTKDLKHQACTEIRASTLSGECRLLEEWLHRKQFSLTGKDGMGQFQECVRRRAVLSVMGRRECTGKEHAESVVKEVWGSCFADTRPFDEVYR
jgi:mitochondrial inner membrane protease ATP23